MSSLAQRTGNLDCEKILDNEYPHYEDSCNEEGKIVSDLYLAMPNDLSDELTTIHESFLTHAEKIDSNLYSPLEYVEMLTGSAGSQTFGLASFYSDNPTETYPALPDGYDIVARKGIIDLG